MKKIVNQLCGSYLMKDIAQAAKIIGAVVRAVDIPVTLKIRKGWDELNLNAPAFAKMAEDEGVQMIVVHGRTRAQLFNGRADWAFIKKVKQSVQIPVIANGDIVDIYSALKAFEISGADGIMIGRGTYGRPWIFNQIKAFLDKKIILSEPTLCQQQAIINLHLQKILELYDYGGAVGIMRKHLGWYTRGIANGATFRANINQCNCPRQIMVFFNQFWEQTLNHYPKNFQRFNIINMHEQ